MNKLDYETGESKSRPWLQALFLVAGGLATLPLGFGVLVLLYAFVIQMEGAREALWMGTALTGGSIVWVIGIWLLYRKLMPRSRWGQSDAA